MRVLFLASGPLVPSSRFRIQPYVRKFRQDGHTCVLANSFPPKYDYFPWMGFRPSQLLKRSVRWWHWLRAKLSSFDIVFVEREIFDDPSTDMEARFRNCCKSFVTDIDDALFLRYPEKFNTLVNMSDLVVCGNRALVEKVHEHHERTLLVPTSVDLDEYPIRPSEKSSDSAPTIGWMGTTENLKYFCLIAESLRMAAATSRFRLRIVAPNLDPIKGLNLDGVQIDHRTWQPETQTKLLHSFDVGIMPLEAKDQWCHYKCGAKLLQYFAVGIPVIASPVGVNSEIVRHLENGMLASDTEEWSSALTELIRNRNLRLQLGENGRSTVEEKYSIDVNYPVLRDGLISTFEG